MQLSLLNLSNRKNLGEGKYLELYMSKSQIHRPLSFFLEKNVN